MSYEMLINKMIGLEKSYVPSNLVNVDSKFKCGIQLDAIAYQQWLELKKDVASKGYIIEVESGYRSYDYQAKILNEVIKDKGSEHAYNAVAIPGHSEHQTGLALDYCICRNDLFITEDEIDNCEECNYTNLVAHKYGFIVRYSKGKEDITGYKYEPWHLRYVGNELATYLFANKLTLDEYYKEVNNEES